MNKSIASVCFLIQRNGIQEKALIGKRNTNKRKHNILGAKIFEKLHAAILVENYTDIIDILEDRIVTLRDRITINGNTALHVAVGTSNNKEFLVKMLDWATQDYQPPFDMCNYEGSTLLHVAAIVGNTKAAKLLVQHQSCHYMLSKKDNEGQTPLHRAVSNMQTDTLIYFLDHCLATPNLENVESFDGTKTVVNAISVKDYVSANKMRKFIKDPTTVLMAIAQNFPPDVFFFARSMFLGSIISQCPKFKREIDAHLEAKLLVNFTCDLIRTSSTMSTTYNNAIFEATRQDSVEIVKAIVSRFPNAIWTSNEDGHDIIQLAVINRSEKVYDLLSQMSKRKNIYRTIKYPYKNKLLYLAARLAPENKIKPAYGPALQMQRELQWFKEVERFVSPLNVIEKNSFGETPQMVFTKEHKKLVIEGEKWMKDRAWSYTITAALVAAIMFVAAITVHGGNKQDNGKPMFANRVAFTVFAASGGISFVTSAAALLIFLSILCDPFVEEDFLFFLPEKLMIGVASLLISTLTMLIAFVATISLELAQNKSWILGVVIVFFYEIFNASWTLQFPILFTLIKSRFSKRTNDLY
ncbi:hypothetical protein E3N88_09654 [Mikania micrantha]|uniref:PGG domain-containing protein n=1 Tax=Mikania micrantha TaxID=192012 RepID=A0A5N6PKI9_9ASTR|nr:hypothetical protein E3N88_09654 [Mikania micrantha]